jgi:hypothetical protein
VRRVAPGSPGPDVGELSGPHQNEVALTDLDVLGHGAALQILGGDRLTRIQPLLALVAREIEEHAAADHAVLDCGYGLFLGANAALRGLL